MQISDYLHVAGRRLALLVLLPLLAAIAAAAFVLVAPSQYTARTTVFSQGLLNTTWSQYTGPQAIGQFSGAFQATATAPSVLVQSAKAAGVAPSDLTQETVSVTQVGTSGNMQVTCSLPQRDAVVKACEEVARTTLSTMFAAPAQVATSAVQQAQTAYDAAGKAVTDYTAEVKIADPVATSDSARSRYNWITQRQVELRATGEGAAAAAMQPSADAANKSVTDLAPIVARYQQLVEARQAASESLRTAENQARSAAVQVQAASAPGVLVSGDVQAPNRVLDALKLALPAAAGGLLIALVLVALLELRAAGRRQKGIDGEDTTAVPATSAEPVDPADRTVSTTTTRTGVAAAGEHGSVGTPVATPVEGSDTPSGSVRS